MLADNARKFIVLGKVNLHELYEEWKKEKPSDGYLEPLTGWQLKYTYAYSNDVASLVFENKKKDGNYYRIMFYGLSGEKIKFLKKVRFKEDEGFSIRAIGIDEKTEMLFVRRRSIIVDKSIYCVSIDNPFRRKGSAERKGNICSQSTSHIVFLDDQIVSFIKLPEEFYIDHWEEEEEFDPQYVYSDLDIVEKDKTPPTAEQKEDEDDTTTKAKVIDLPAQNKKTAMEELQELIGLQDIKQQTEQIVAFAKLQKLARQQGRQIEMINLNLAFTGNPGTAKTTAARVFARVMKENGLVSKGGLMEVGRADLVAKYLGQTAIKVKDVFQKAKGNVLFIDEAYSLVDNCDNEYGDEAIATIVQEMENNRDDLIVIFAGYPDKMQEFLSKNPGLRSRVPYVIRFDDYSAEELVAIAKSEATRKGYTIDPDAQEKILELCKNAMRSGDFGNGRFSRNLIDAAVMKAAVRTVSNVDEAASLDECFTLVSEDFEMPSSLQIKKLRRPIGFLAA